MRKEGNGAIDFLQTKTSVEDLATCLQVIKEFKSLETLEEYMARPLATWTMLELLEEYLEYLTGESPLKENSRIMAVEAGIITGD